MSGPPDGAHEHHHHGRFPWSHHHDRHHLFREPDLRAGVGLRTVLTSLAVLGVTAALQAVLFASTGSVALLADLIHNAGDALTAIPLGIAFILRSRRAEHAGGRFVVIAIAISACVALVETVRRLIDPSAPDHLWTLAAAGVIGAAGNWLAATLRLRGGRRIASAALIADGAHARVDALVSLGVVLSAALVAAGADIADPIVGLALTAIILRITWQAWQTVRSEGDSSTLAP